MCVRAMAAWLLPEPLANPWHKPWPCTSAAAAACTADLPQRVIGVIRWARALCMYQGYMHAHACACPRVRKHMHRHSHSSSAGAAYPAQHGGGGATCDYTHARAHAHRLTQTRTHTHAAPGRWRAPHDDPLQRLAGHLLLLHLAARQAGGGRRAVHPRRTGRGVRRAAGRAREHTGADAPGRWAGRQAGSGRGMCGGLSLGAAHGGGGGGSGVRGWVRGK